MKIDFDLGSAKSDSFSSMYADINHHVLNSSNSVKSRNGEVKEVLDFKTILTNPYRRCVGGYKRDINIFFLLAEAIWIALGKKDVKFLTIFNSRMSEFSDDGYVFHAPYGWRLRNWGVRSEDKLLGDSLGFGKGYDQVVDAIRILSQDPDSRQVVMSIWNPSFDLGFKTKDIPCNDMVMLKIRNNKLITTISNRSNDLHWGLPTNVFQFSFLTELMSASLGIELGKQTHNSQSLHIYGWNDVAGKMDDLYEKKKAGDSEVVGDIYADCNAREKKIDFNFKSTVPAMRFREIEIHLNIIVNNLSRFNDDQNIIEEEIRVLKQFSSYLYSVYNLLKLYISYKKYLSITESMEDKGVLRDNFRNNCLDAIEVIEGEFLDYENLNWDIALLAKNFFATRLKNNVSKLIGNL